MDVRTIKLELVQQLLLTENEELLVKVQNILSADSENFELSDEHKKILDERKARADSGEGRSFSWEEVKEQARSAKK